MRPVLFVIPAPSGMSLAPLLVGLALIALVVGALGFRGRARDLTAIGFGTAVVSGVAAIWLRGAEYRMSGFPVQGYGAALCLAVLSGLAVARSGARRDGLPLPEFTRTLVVGAAVGLLGARLLYVLTNFGAFHSVAAVFALRRGGFSLYGGLLLGTLSAWLYCRKQPLQFRLAADVAAPAVALCIAIGRLGCYAFGCDFGRPLGGWAPEWLKRLGTFPRWESKMFPIGTGSPSWMHHVMERGLPFSSESSIPVHPTQLYESMGALIVAGLALVLRRRRRWGGQIALGCVIAYALLRFALELYRDDPERGLWGPKLPAEWILTTAALIVAGALAVGPIRAFAVPRYRWAVSAAAFIVVPCLYFICRWTRVPDFANWAATAPQWIAVAPAAAACITWRKLEPA